LDAVVDRLNEPDLVTLRLKDASLVAGMEIPSLDDAQVAAQRIAQQGAPRVLIRCGKLPTHFYDQESSPPDYALDLFFDGEDFALFEAPYLSGFSLHGASSGLLLPLLKHLENGLDVEPALQRAKGRVSEALRAAQHQEDGNQTHAFFSALENEPTVAEA
jgi:hydroxymethylpyrimidine/phosphomethylpyrimidine kinase